MAAINDKEPSLSTKSTKDSVKSVVSQTSISEKSTSPLKTSTPAEKSSSLLEVGATSQEKGPPMTERDLAMEASTSGDLPKSNRTKEVCSQESPINFPPTQPVSTTLSVSMESDSLNTDLCRSLETVDEGIMSELSENMQVETSRVQFHCEAKRNIEVGALLSTVNVSTAFFTKYTNIRYVTAFFDCIGYD